MASILGDAVPAESVRTDAWLTAFEDHRWPGGTDDLFFVPSTDESPVIPEPIEIKQRVVIPLMLDVVALVICGWLVWRRKRAA